MGRLCDCSCETCGDRLAADLLDHLSHPVTDKGWQAEPATRRAFEDPSYLPESNLARMRAGYLGSTAQGPVIDRSFAAHIDRAVRSPFGQAPDWVHIASMGSASAAKKAARRPTRPAVKIERALFPDRHPLLHRLLRWFGPYYRRQDRLLGERYARQVTS